MSDNQTPEKVDFHPLPPHWDTDWAEEGVANNLLPWWLIALWVGFLLWGVLFIIENSSSW